MGFLFMVGPDLKLKKSEKTRCIECKKEDSMIITSHRKYVRGKCPSCGYKWSAKKSDMNMSLELSLGYYAFLRSGIVDRALKEIERNNEM